MIQHPEITAIVTHHLNENDAYVNACVRSLLESVDVNMEIIVVSSAEKSPEAAALPGVRVVHSPELNNASKKVNWAVTQAYSDSKYLLLVSDDVIVSKRCISTMMAGLKLIGDKGITQPLSNGDNGSRFVANLTIENEHGETLRLPVKATLEEIRPFERAIKDRFAGGPLLIPQAWLSFFCVMIPKACWNEVGELDQRLDSRHNDQDYCIRATQKGLPSVLNVGAFAFHFGDRTLPKVTTRADLDECSRVFQEKWTKRVEAVA